MIWSGFFEINTLSGIDFLISVASEGKLSENVEGDGITTGDEIGVGDGEGLGLGLGLGLGDGDGVGNVITAIVAAVEQILAELQDFT